MPNRAEFATLIETLITRIEGDLDDPEWVKKRYVKKMRDADRTVYEIPFLTLQKGPVRLSLDPTGYDIPGAEAAVDLYLMPTFDPLATFYSEGGHWSIDSGFLPEPEDERLAEEGRWAPFSHDTLNHLMDAIAEHAVPSL